MRRTTRVLNRITAKVSHRLLQYCHSFRFHSRRENFSLLHDPNPPNQPLRLLDEMDRRSLDRSKRLKVPAHYPDTTTKATTRAAVLVCSSERKRQQHSRKHDPCRITVQSTLWLAAAA